MSANKFMKHILAAIALVTALTASAQNIEIRTQVTTVTNVVVEPITITAEQFGGIIQAVQASGISASIQLTPELIESVTVTRDTSPVRVFQTNSVPVVSTVVDAPEVRGEQGEITTPAVTHTVTNMVDKVELQYEYPLRFKVQFNLH